MFENFDGLFVIRTNQIQHFLKAVVQFQRRKTFHMYVSPLKLRIFISSSLKSIKAVKGIWKTCQTKQLSKTLSSDHLIYHFLSLHSLQTNFNNRLETNQGVVEHPALPVCWTSDVWQSGMMLSEAATKTTGIKVQFKLDLKLQTLT